MKAYVKIDNGVVIDRIITSIDNLPPEYIELPFEFAFTSKRIFFDGNNFTLDTTIKTTQEQLLELQEVNTQLQSQLEITQTVIDELLLGGIGV